MENFPKLTQKTPAEVVATGLDGAPTAPIETSAATVQVAEIPGVVMPNTSTALVGAVDPTQPETPPADVEISSKLGDVVKLVGASAIAVAAVKVGMPHEVLRDAHGAASHGVGAGIGLWGTRRAKRLSEQPDGNHSREVSRLNMNGADLNHATPINLPFNQYFRLVFLPAHEADLRQLVADEYPGKPFAQVTAQEKEELIKANLMPIAFREHQSLIDELQVVTTINDGIQKARQDRIKAINSGPKRTSMQRFSDLQNNLRVDAFNKERAEKAEIKILSDATYGEGSVDSEANYLAARRNLTRRADRKALDRAYERTQHMTHEQGNILGHLGDGSRIHVTEYKAVTAARAVRHLVKQPGNAGRALIKAIATPARALGKNISELRVENMTEAAGRLETEASFHIRNHDEANQPTTKKTAAQLQELANKKVTKAAELRAKAAMKQSKATAKANARALKAHRPARAPKKYPVRTFAQRKLGLRFTKYTSTPGHHGGHP